MAMNISCKLEKASYNIFFVRAVTVKSLYTLRRRRRRRRNEVKSIVSTGCYPVDTITADLLNSGNLKVAIAQLYNELQFCNFTMS